MREVRIQAEVPAPLEAVWSVFTDYRSWTEWSGIKEVVLRSPGEPAPYGVGAVVVLRARGVAIEEEITHFEPPHRLTYRIVEGLPLRSHASEVLLFTAGENTRIVWRVELSPWVPGTGPWIARMFQSQLARILERLARHPRAIEALRAAASSERAAPGATARVEPSPAHPDSDVHLRPVASTRAR